MINEFQSTRLSRASTRIFLRCLPLSFDFNPQGSHEPRLKCPCALIVKVDFNPQGSHEPRLVDYHKGSESEQFQSTRLSRASTAISPLPLATLVCNFNPQGSHEPRRDRSWRNIRRYQFQSTRLSRASTWLPVPPAKPGLFQSTRLSRASTWEIDIWEKSVGISIHKALTSLDD